MDKKTGFDKATGALSGEVIDGEVGATEGASPAPRAIFTREQTIDPSKVQVAQLRIVQGMSAEIKEKKAQSGQFMVSNFSAYDAVTLIPLGSANIRVYKPDPRAAAACHAPTGIWGIGNPGGQCVDEEGHAVCPMAAWGPRDEATGKSKPPACKDGITIRFYSVTHRCMVDYQFMAGDRGKGSFIEQQAMGFGWCNFAIKLSSALKENNKGSWYVTDIEMLPDDSPLVNDEQRGTAQKWFEIFSQMQVETNAEALIQLQAIN